MKRVISLIVAIAILTVALPFSSHAAEIDTEYDALVALACEVFPEYSSKISNPPSLSTAQSRNIAPRKLEYVETRKFAENQSMTYSEYSDGVVLLTWNDYAHTTVQNGQEISGTNTTTTITVTALCNIVSGSCKLTNMKYTISRSSYDRIDSAGSISYSGNCSLHTAYTPIWNETSSQKAHIAYRLKWYLGPRPGDFIASVVSLTVGNNGASVSHIDYDDYIS